MEVQTNGKLPLPLGIERYAEAESECYYVDKTLLIRDLLNVKTPVKLFTRPRRFGKTLNMDMLRVFFEKSDEDTSVFFQNRQIWTCSEEYRREQGRYPVIALSFKDIEGADWESAYGDIKFALSTEYRRHLHAMDRARMDADDLSCMERFKRRQADATEVKHGFPYLQIFCIGITEKRL